MFIVSLRGMLVNKLETSKILKTCHMNLSLFSPVLANLFMGFHEKGWITSYNEPPVMFYKRYVDDIFCIFESETEAFHCHLNNQHPNIKFTCERESNRQLPFLDVLISFENNCFSTSVYRKNTCKGLFTNYMSFTPFSFKIGLVKTLLNRAFNICSSWFYFHEEVVNITHFLQKNMFPPHVIDREINCFIDSKFAIS